MGLTRREFMVGAGATLAAPGTSLGFPAIAQRRPLKVGVFISEVDAQDNLPGGPVGRRHEEHAIEAARPPEGGVDGPGHVGGTKDEHALVVAIEAIHLAQELAHEVGRAGGL